MPMTVCFKGPLDLSATGVVPQMTKRSDFNELQGNDVQAKFSDGLLDSLVDGGPKSTISRDHFGEATNRSTSPPLGTSLKRRKAIFRPAFWRTPMYISL